MSYFHQHIRPKPHTNMSYCYQTIQLPPMQPTQPLSDSHAPQQTVPLTSSEACHRSNKNWSKDEDLQLTIAWCRILSDHASWVGLKKGRVWERVAELFVELMESKHGMKPENNVRNPGGCENRMSEIKSQCSRWAAVRSRALAQKHSGMSELEFEKLCHSMHEAEGKGAFRWEDCWNVLKEDPKWQKYCNKKAGNKTVSQAVTPSPYTYAPIHEGVGSPNDLTPDNMETQTSVTPMTESTHLEPEVGSNSRGTCSPILDGPASNDIERPTKKAKATNQKRQRRIKQHLQAQSSACKTFTAGLMTLQSETNARWEKLEDANRMRELKDEERYNDMRRMQILEHEMKVASSRSELAEKREVLGQKLLNAIQLLDQIDPLSLVTSTQRMVYEVRRKTVEDYQESYEALGDMLNKLKNISPPGLPEENIASVGKSERHLFNEEEVNVGKDS